jgi:hypothetical protein
MWPRPHPRPLRPISVVCPMDSSAGISTSRYTYAGWRCSLHPLFRQRREVHRLCYAAEWDGPAVLLPLTADRVSGGLEREEHTTMPCKTDVAIACTIGIDTGKNTLHMIGLDEKGAIVLREKVSRGRIAARLVNVPQCLILKLGDPDSSCPRHHRDSHRKDVQRPNGIWESCSDTEDARMSQCLRRLV